MPYHKGSEGLLSLLSPWLVDGEVSEIMANRPGEIWVERQGKMSCHQILQLTENHMRWLLQLIAHEQGRVFNQHAPILSVTLPHHRRLEGLIAPVTPWPIFSIRLTQSVVPKLEGLTSSIHPQRSDQSIQEHWKSLYQKGDIKKLIQHAILHQKTVVISGGTSSGKTTFLKSILNEIPAHERLIVIEDTAEIELERPNSVSLLATQTAETPGISMARLIQSSLRLRPDRIIIGEIRSGEIMEFTQACSTGHPGSLVTLHANSARQALDRMVSLYQMNPVQIQADEIRKLLLSVVDLFIHLGKAGSQRGIEELWCPGLDE